MSQSYRGGPDSTSRFVLPDGRSAVLVPRERKHFSSLRKGYPLAEEFLDSLANDDVDAIALDDGNRIYVFDRQQYQRGNRMGHDPYPMKRVLPLDDATLLLSGSERDTERRAAEWEWLADRDLQPVTGQTDRTEAAAGARL